MWTRMLQRRETDMWKLVRDAIQNLCLWLRESVEERRAAQARAQFWAELRAGQREAEARLRP